MNPQWRERLAPACILASTLALLCFRHFVSLDGPMHLLHAAIQKDALLGVVRGSQGLWVDARMLDLNLADLVLISLSGTMHPFLLHKLLAAVSVAVLTCGAWYLSRAYVRVVNAGWLLVLPCAFGFMLVMGLFHFIIAAGIAFASAGWWVRRENVRWRELLALALCCALSAFAHKAGGVLAVFLVGVHELLLFLGDRAAWRRRWDAFPRWFAPGIAAMAFACGTALLFWRLSSTPVLAHEEHHPLRELLSLRPLLLVDSRAEFGMRIGFGVLLMGLCGTAAVHRWKHARALRPGDALLVSAFVLIVLSFVRTPKAELLYTTDRAQWLALLLACGWASLWPLPKRMVLVSVAAILVLHTGRLVFIERRMHQMEARDRAVLVAARCLEPGALVVPAVMDDHWLTRHLTAYAALEHRGVLFTGREHVRIRWNAPLNVFVRRYLVSLEKDWTWIGPHIERDQWPRLEQVLIIGDPAEGWNPHWPELQETLRTHYRPVCMHAHAQVWSLRAR